MVKLGCLAANIIWRGDAIFLPAALRSGEVGEGEEGGK